MRGITPSIELQILDRNTCDGREYYKNKVIITVRSKFQSAIRYQEQDRERT
jgi:hypothetical protein